MRDTELYRQILGIESPWEVDEVELDRPGGEVRVHLSHSERRPECPECGQATSRYDSRPRRWRHLDTCQYETILIAEVPRIECPEHGVRQVRVPWGEPGSRFTALLEALVIDWLHEASITAVARQFRLSWEAVAGIMERAVRRGLARRPPQLATHLGVDETSFQRRHEYVTVVLDRQPSGGVLHVADGRGREGVDEYFASFTPEQRASVESVSMDMHGPFIASIRVAERWAAFETLRRSTLKTARAWSLKELAMSLWDYSSRGWAKRAWLAWYNSAIRCRLEPVRRVARMVRRHLDGILNAIVRGATNARSESVNAKIQWIKYTARGFRNRQRFRDAIYFHLGALDLYPATLRK
jgi:transposase